MTSPAFTMSPADTRCEVILPEISVETAIMSAAIRASEVDT
jgi:hypothetical protein